MTVSRNPRLWMTRAAALVLADALDARWMTIDEDRPWESTGQAEHEYRHALDSMRLLAAAVIATPVDTSTFSPEFERWRHGGWYVYGVTYPSGAIGCVSRNYSDGKWRIVCDPRGDGPTFASRDQAARAEYALVESVKRSRRERAQITATSIGVSP